MRVVGIDSSQARVVDFVVGHGEHPDAGLHRRGWVSVQPLTAVLADGDVTVDVAVRPVTPDDTAPVERAVVHEEPSAHETPRIHQRIGAYAVVISSAGLLGTVYSAATNVRGMWGLPGGGLDVGEEPEAGLLREVYEETGQRITPGQLLALQSDHWIGRAPGGSLEDYHILRIIYAATCENPSRPVLHDLGGSTERADWIAFDTWAELRWSRPARTALTRYFGQSLK